MRIFYFMLICCISAFSATAQSDILEIVAPDQIAGKWVGKLIQDQGGLAKEYYFELNLSYKDHKIGGSSYIKVKHDEKTISHATMELKGSLSGAIVSIQETKIAKFEIIPMAQWCLKKMNLQLDFYEGRYRLKGKWTGVSGLGDCVPGEIEVWKEAPKA